MYPLSVVISRGGSRGGEEVLTERWDQGEARSLPSPLSTCSECQTAISKQCITHDSCWIQVCADLCNNSCFFSTLSQPIGTFSVRESKQSCFISQVTGTETFTYHELQIRTKQRKRNRDWQETRHVQAFILLVACGGTDFVTLLVIFYISEANHMWLLSNKMTQLIGWKVTLMPDVCISLSMELIVFWFGCS